MPQLFDVGQLLSLVALAWGAGLSIRYWHLGDVEIAQRQLDQGPLKGL